MQLTGKRGDGVVDHRGAAPLVERSRDDLAGGRYRDVDGDAADLGQRLGFFLRDPLLR